MSPGDAIIDVPFYGYIVGQTDLAIGLADEPFADAEVWLPKSQVHAVHYEDGGEYRGDDYEENVEVAIIEMPRWLAREHDWVDDDDDEYLDPNDYWGD